MNDPIVAAVQKTREELAAAFDFDVHAIFTELRRKESKLGDRLVRQPQPEKSEESTPPSDKGRPTAKCRNRLNR